MTEGESERQLERQSGGEETGASSVRFWLGGAAGAIYALLVGLPQMDAGKYSGLVSVAGTLVFTVLSVVLVMQVARLRLDWRAEVAGLVVAGGVWMLADRAAGIGKVEQLYAGAGGSVAFIFSCLMGGRLLSRILRERNILLPVAGVAILADIFTVFVGPAGKALAKAPQLVQKFSVGLPTAGSAVPGAHLPPTVGTMGLGDFIFLALFLTAAARFGFPLRRGGRIIATLVCVALAAYLLLPPILPGIPLLPLIGGGFLIAYWRRFDLSKAERQALLWGGLFLVALLAAAGWAMKK